MGEFGMNTNNKVNSSPCLGCNKRKVGCHSTCREYGLHKFKMEYYNRRKNKEKKNEQAYIKHVQDTVYRITKGKNKRCAR